MPELNGLAALIAALPRLAETVTAAQQAGRRAAVAVVRDAVVATIGEAAGGDGGPFPAWPDLAQATQAARMRHGFAPDAAELATGRLAASIEGGVAADGRAAVGVPDAIAGTGQPGDPVRNIGEVAVAQETGTGTLPPRSFLGLGAHRAAQDAASAFVAPVIAVLAGMHRTEGDAPHGDD